MDHEGEDYLYEQVASLLRERIAKGDLPAGRVLPSSRALAQQYEVSIGTIKKATEILKNEGLLHTKIGRGIFVTSAG